MIQPISGFETVVDIFENIGYITIKIFLKYGNLVRISDPFHASQGQKKRSNSFKLTLKNESKKCGHINY